jgi:hypothetical protein
MANIELTTVTGTDLAATRGGFARVGGMYQAATRADALAATIPADVAVIQTLAFAASGDGGGGFYKELGSAPTLTTNPAYLHIGSRWFQLVPNPFVHVLQFGWKADYVRGVSGTDNLAAFEHVKAFVTSFAPNCPQVLVPPGKFYFSGLLEIKGGQQRWTGSGSGREYHIDGGPSTQFWFPDNTAGMITAIHSTTGSGLSGTDGIGGDGSIIEGIALFSESDGFPTGIDVNATYTTTNGDSSLTGASGTGAGLRDRQDNTNATVWGTASAAGGSITADLGSIQVVSYIRVQSIPFGGWTPNDINGATIEVSSNGTSWTAVGTVSGVVAGRSTPFPLGVDSGTPSGYRMSRTCRYVRLTFSGHWFGLAEFRVLANPPEDVGFDGFWLRCRATLRDVQAIGFPRHGCNITAATDGNAQTLGNANLWDLSHFTFNFNGENGIYARGADANAGVAFMGNCSFNAGWGVFDTSFLKNTWLGIHTESNGHAAGTMNASYAGKMWLLVAGQEFYSSITTPGTDGSVWMEWTNPPSGRTSGTWCVPWSGQPFLSNGPFASRGGIWSGNYAEDGQAPVHMTNGAFFMPLINENSYTPLSMRSLEQGGGNIILNGRHFNGVETGQNSNTGYFTGLGDNTLDGGVGTIVKFYDNVDGSGDNYQMRMRLNDNQDVVIDAGATTRGYSSLRSIVITTPTTFSTFGRTNPVPLAVAPNRLMLPGNVEITSGTAAPTTGERKQGDIHLNTNVTSGQPEGWRCIVSGTPGTWTAMANHP